MSVSINCLANDTANLGFFFCHWDLTLAALGQAGHIEVVDIHPFHRQSILFYHPSIDDDLHFLVAVRQISLFQPFLLSIRRRIVKLFSHIVILGLNAIGVHQQDDVFPTA